VKDPAQTGSGIHGIIKKIAINSNQEADSKLSDRNLDRDKGSLYRYGDEVYGEELTRSFLQAIEEEIQRKYIPPFLSTVSV
jgi:asparagine synthase (glutamine-hydrolysing)